MARKPRQSVTRHVGPPKKKKKKRKLEAIGYTKGFIYPANR